MDQCTLELILHQIAEGRDEGQTLEWKRQWWPLDDKAGKDEFRRDVAAMVNGIAGDQPRHFIIGVKGRQLYDSPLPRDEAELQTVISTIDPVPRARFLTFRVRAQHREVVIAVIELSPPFDPPYFVVGEGRTSIPIRRGSRVGNATRKEVDSFYRPRVRSVQLGLRWCVRNDWPGRSEGIYQDVLELPLLSLSREALEADLLDRIAEAEAAHEANGYPPRDEIQRFRSEVGDYLGDLKTQEGEFYWCQVNLDLFKAPCVAVEFENGGTTPATGVSCAIDLPRSVFCFSSDHLRSERLKRLAGKPYISTSPPEPTAGRRRRDFRSLHHDMHGSLDRFGLHRIFMPQPPPVDGSWYKSGSHQIGYWADRVAHAHRWSVGGGEHMAVNPWAVDRLGEIIDVAVRVFCEEYSGWESSVMKIKLGCVEDTSPT